MRKEGGWGHAAGRVLGAREQRDLLRRKPYTKMKPFLLENGLWPWVVGSEGRHHWMALLRSDGWERWLLSRPENF